MEEPSQSSSRPPAIEVDLDVDGDPDHAVIVALGSNDKGAWRDGRQALEAALARFRSEGIDVLARSRWWASQAWPDPTDPPFLNGVAVVRTDQGPHALMSTLARIEDAFGRQRSVRNAPRTLDLDLIAHGRAVGDCEGVILPHPRAAERLFVMGPIAEILPDWRHPILGRTARDLAREASVGCDAAPVET